MKAVIIGAGRIGRGFVTELLTKNNVSLTFFDYNKDLVQEMNRNRKYTIHVLGNASKNSEISGYQAFSIDDDAALAKEWKSTDFIFTAVGGKNLKIVAAFIAKAFSRVYAAQAIKNINIVTCENWIEPAKELKEAILSNLSAEEQKVFKNYVGVSESVIMASGVSAPPNEVVTNSVDTWVQDFWYLPIDKSRIIGEIPKWEYFSFIDGFGDLLQQKLYTNNTSVALIAYLGYLKGHTYVADAANDPEIEEILDLAYQEINQALIKGLNIDEKSQLVFSKRAKEKYQNRDIIDVLVRIARDPIRKLSPADRLIGPAQLALKAGVKPYAISLAAAAALFFDYPEDKDAVKLKEMRLEKGIDGILKDICELKTEDELYAMIMESIEELKKRHWLK